MANSLNDTIENSARGGFFLVSGNVLANLVLAAGLYVVSNLLEADLYGAYTLCLALPSILILFVDLGVNTGIIRYCASFCAKGQEARAAKFLKYGIIFELVTASVAFLISFALSDYFATNFLNQPNLGFYIKLASLTIPFQAIVNIATSSFVSFNRMKNAALIANLQAITKVSISVSLILLAFGVAGAITGVLTSYMLSCVVAVFLLSLIYYRKLTRNGQDNTNFKESIKTLVSFGFPLYASTLIGGFIPQYQSVTLGLFASNAEVGNFKAAANMLTILGMIAGPVSTTLFPAFSRMDKDSEEIKKLFQVSVKYTTLFIVPSTVLVLLFSKDIAHIAYPSGYASVPMLLAVYCTNYLLVGLGYLVLGSFFNGTGNSLTTFKMSLIGFALVVPLTPVLTMQYGTIGLIVAQLTSNLCGTVYGLRIIRSRFKIRLFRGSIVRIYVVSALAAFPVVGLLVFSPLWWVWTMILGVLTYLFVLLTLIPLGGPIHVSELQNIERILARIPFLKKLSKPFISYLRTLFAYRTG